MANTFACVFCKGEAELKFEDLRLFGGKITLKSQPYYKCLKCGREYATSKQMLQTEKELRTSFVFKKSVIEG